MLNMLIAMMGKSFDVIWESAAATYLSGFAQNVLTCASTPAAPHPLSVLSLPYQAQAALRRVLRGGTCMRDMHTRPELAYALLRPHASEAAGAHAEAADASRTATEQQQRMREQRKREQQRLEVMQEYVMEHEDDVAEEERWRTKMHKAFTERSHKLEARLRVAVRPPGEA